MTNTAVPTSVHTTEEARKRLARRYAAERRFKFYGVSAILLACLFLVLLLWSVVGQAFPAFTAHYLSLPIDLKSQFEAEGIDPSDPESLRSFSFPSAVQDALQAYFPYVEGRNEQRALRGLISSGAAYNVSREVAADFEGATADGDVRVLLSSEADLYFKGLVSSERVSTVNLSATITPLENNQLRITTEGNAFQDIVGVIKQRFQEQANAASATAVQRAQLVARLEAEQRAVSSELGDLRSQNTQGQPLEAMSLERIEARLSEIDSQLERFRTERDNFAVQAREFEAKASTPGGSIAIDRHLPSFLLEIAGGVVKVQEARIDSVVGEVYVPLESTEPVPAGSWQITRIERPEVERKLGDREIAWLNELENEGAISRGINTTFFATGASREPEQAGIWGAVVGSFWTMLVTLALSFPVGVAAAIYLEEFAPKNRLTDIIEVNINNLAAVPSIVFGLLGLAVFLNFFGFPRSAPVAGGMVLALMTLPTIIIASRAALRAVPPSIREAALGVGASKIQTVFHHVLPLAMPGIMTGTIIGMAQALGETAPLLMIGMVAFIVDIPQGPLSSATVLPVQIFMWSDFPEVGFQQKTAAAILVLLGFLIVMNLLAVVLRRRFERRW